MYPIFTCFFIFAIFTFIFMNRSKSNISKERELFLERERAANSVRKQPLTDLDYVNLSADLIPEVESDDPYILERLSTLNVLCEPDTKIVNLSSYSNTDLKLKYGVANLNILTEYDQNFTNLCRCLFELGSRLYSTGDIEKATAFLELGIKCGTDLKSHFTLLADIYEQNMQYKEIVGLIHKTGSVNATLRDALVKDLTKRLEGTNYSVDEEDKPLEDVCSN